MVPLPGLEPGLLSETNFESAAAANFTIGALVRMVFERLQITSLLLSFLLNPSLGFYRINFCGIEPLRQILKICFYPKIFAELILLTINIFY